MTALSTPVLPDAPAAPLPVLALLKEAYQSILAHPGVVARLVGSWVAVGLVAPLAVLPFVGLTGMIGLGLFATLIMILSMVSTSVGWHRFLLLGEQPSTIYLKLDRNVGRYAVGVIILSLLSWLMMFLMMLIIAPIFAVAGSSTAGLTVAGLVATGIVFGLILFVMPRFALILPARAIGKPMTVTAALDLTRGNVVRLALASMSVAVPAYVLVALQAAIEDKLASQTAIVLIGAVMLLLYSMVSMAAVGILSAIYRHLTTNS
jgi:hypothetical protein